MLDMASNVWERVADWRCEHPSERQVNPTGPASGFDKKRRLRAQRVGWFDYGFGGERPAMVKHGTGDIHLFYGNDPRFSPRLSGATMRPELPVALDAGWRSGDS